MLQNIQSVAIMRSQIQARTLEVEKKPGVYCWWFPEEAAEKILSLFRNSQLVQAMLLQRREIQGEGFVALYFGISNNMNRRIRWHINGPFKSSTLRRTLRAIIAPDADEAIAEMIVNHLIDNCYWEWEYTETTKLAELRELAELNHPDHCYPLNIKDNHSPLIPEVWIAELKEKRTLNK